MHRWVVYVLVILLFAIGIYFYVLNIRGNVDATDQTASTGENLPTSDTEPEDSQLGSEPAPAPAPDPDGPAVRINSLSIPVDLALTDATRQRGLSGRPSLAADSGMLFVFEKPAIYNFWMPDMNFPIDIIWINDGRVVGISADVPNDFDPANPVYYRPPSPAQYVLEVNAGFAARHGIATGDGVELPNAQAQ